MTTKISNELLGRLKDMGDADLQREIPVIVTVKPGVDLAALEQKGLKIERTFENISAVSGALTAAVVYDVAELDEVESIEYDGEVWHCETV